MEGQYWPPHEVCVGRQEVSSSCVRRAEGGRAKSQDGKTEKVRGDDGIVKVEASKRVLLHSGERGNRSGGGGQRGTLKYMNRVPYENASHRQTGNLEETDSSYEPSSIEEEVDRNASEGCKRDERRKGCSVKRNIGVNKGCRREGRGASRIEGLKAKDRMHSMRGQWYTGSHQSYRTGTQWEGGRHMQRRGEKYKVGFKVKWAREMKMKEKQIGVWENKENQDILAQFKDNSEYLKYLDKEEALAEYEGEGATSDNNHHQHLHGNGVYKCLQEEMIEDEDDSNGFDYGKLYNVGDVEDGCGEDVHEVKDYLMSSLDVEQEDIVEGFRAMCRLLSALAIDIDSKGSYERHERPFLASDDEGESVQLSPSMPLKLNQYVNVCCRVQCLSRLRAL
ncbi:hypothetical protein Cgig2_021754 [Carnegiea gigantea]|uniref:Uncharacterized protein n=1 Tax=Carnegiea gigantea TaxID=171969 RepID=A0A9Q1JRX6_9CARY|nr:hypothetical protein Cgig2_021754 [Carnegiea gigantea]